jgi:hypothetical protein
MTCLSTYPSQTQTTSALESSKLFYLLAFSSNKKRRTQIVSCLSFSQIVIICFQADPLAGESNYCDRCHEDDCFIEVFRRGEQIIRTTWKIYVLVHVIPFLLFKRKKWSKNKFKETLKLLFGILRSFTLVFSYGGLGTLVWCYDKKISNKISSKTALFFGLTL